MSGSNWRSAGKSRGKLRAALKRAAAVAALSCIFAPPAGAETLRQSLAAAYGYNPKLDAERARLRATDEDVARAESGYRPVVQGSADYGQQYSATSPKSATSGDGKPWGYSLSVRQSVFSGFRTQNQVSEAEAAVKAGREELRGVETEVLLNAVKAYLDVVAATSVVRIRENNVSVLTQEMEAAQTRRSVREVTRTDVAQSQARQARALAAADLAKSELKTARATFERIIGHAPDKLVPPPLRMKELPKSIEEAWQIGEQQNPNVTSALYREEAARFAVDKVRGELLPEVNIEASYGYRGDPNPAYYSQDSAAITGRLSVPLYDGGDVRARVRQAKHVHVSRLQEIEQARSEAQEAVTTAWSALNGQRAKLKSDSVQMEANRVALEGVREEQKVGQRTLLDVLNAEQEYLDSQIELVSSRREVVLAGYRLLAAMGKLNSDDLGLTATVYDPAEHLEEIRGKWFGIDITHADGRREIYDAADIADDPTSPESAP